MRQFPSFNPKKLQAFSYPSTIYTTKLKKNINMTIYIKSRMMMMMVGVSFQLSNLTEENIKKKYFALLSEGKRYNEFRH